MKQILSNSYRTIEFLIGYISNSDSREEFFFSIVKEMYQKQDMTCFELTQSSSRNLVQIVQHSSTSFILKQPVDLMKSEWIKNERNFWLSITSHFSQIEHLLPQYVKFFDSENILVSKYFDFPTLEMYMKRLVFLKKVEGNISEVTRRFSVLGKDCRALHEALKKYPTDQFKFQSSVYVPLIPKELIDEKVQENILCSISNLECLKYLSAEIKMLSSNDISALIIEYNQLRVDNELIHFDLRLSNVLFNDNNCIFLDWEMIGYGDCFWDVVTLLNSIVNVMAFDTDRIEASANVDSSKLTLAKNMIQVFLKSYFGDENVEHNLPKILIFWRMFYLRTILKSSENNAIVSNILTQLLGIQ